MSLNSKKSTSGEVSSKLLQKSANICSFVLKNCFNSCLDQALFPEPLKRATITPVFKEGDSMSVKNYRPISILPTVSKIFEKIIAQQVKSFSRKLLLRVTVWLQKRAQYTACLTALIKFSWFKVSINIIYTHIIIPSNFKQKTWKISRIYCFSYFFPEKNFRESAFAEFFTEITFASLPKIRENRESFSFKVEGI